MVNAFISGDYTPIEKLQEFLSKEYGLHTELDWYIGNRLLQVNKKEYLKALTYGSLYAMREKELNICWVSPDNERMHNMDDLAIISKKALESRRIVNQGEVDKLAELKFSSNPRREFKEDEFSIS